MNSPFSDAQTFVTTMTHVSSRHLPALAVASRARLRLAPTLPAYGLTDGGALSTRTEGIEQHSGGDTLHAVFVGEVCTLAGFQDKVVGGVVQSVAIFVVNNFNGGEVSPKGGLHYQPMLHHPSRLWGGWVRRLVDLTVSLAIPDLNLTSCADGWSLASANTLTVFETHRSKAGSTHRSASEMGPADDYRGTCGTRKAVVRRWFHIRSIPEVRRKRNSKQKSEWLTLNRPALVRPAEQVSLFGAA